MEKSFDQLYDMLVGQDIYEIIMTHGGVILNTHLQGEITLTPSTTGLFLNKKLIKMNVDDQIRLISMFGYYKKFTCRLDNEGESVSRKLVYEPSINLVTTWKQSHVTKDDYLTGVPYISVGRPEWIHVTDKSYGINKGRYFKIIEEPINSLVSSVRVIDHNLDGQEKTVVYRIARNIFKLKESYAILIDRTLLLYTNDGYVFRHRYRDTKSAESIWMKL